MREKFSTQTREAVTGGSQNGLHVHKTPFLGDLHPFLEGFRHPGIIFLNDKFCNLRPFLGRQGSDLVDDFNNTHDLNLACMHVNASRQTLAAPIFQGFLSFLQKNGACETPRARVVGDLISWALRPTQPCGYLTGFDLLSLWSFSDMMAR